MSQLTTAVKLMRKAGKKGLPNYEFPRNRILRYSQVIKTLRDEHGMNILVEREYLPNGRATNVYRYILIEEEKTPWWKLTHVK